MNRQDSAHGSWKTIKRGVNKISKNLQATTKFTVPQEWKRQVPHWGFANIKNYGKKNTLLGRPGAPVLCTSAAKNLETEPYHYGTGAEDPVRTS